MAYVITFAIIGVVFVYAAISYQAEIDEYYNDQMEYHYKKYHS